VFAFLWATGRLPYLSNAAAFADWKGLALFLGGLAFTPVWRDAHFYFAHRLLHYKPLYRQVHSLHHRNQDIEPFAGLCMHPIEHLCAFDAPSSSWRAVCI
jgi:sterol desaturase/sphingolipid hydroxylase (fatty acid hydroxylase superfamily)